MRNFRRNFPRFTCQANQDDEPEDCTDVILGVDGFVSISTQLAVTFPHEPWMTSQIKLLYHMYFSCSLYVFFVSLLTLRDVSEVIYDTMIIVQTTVSCTVLNEHLLWGEFMP